MAVKPPDPGRTRRVLVVDDSAFARRALVSMIRSQPGFEVAASAVDGEEAIRLTLRHRPDLIVLDLELPRVGGLGFLRWLMRHHPVPVLVVTGARGGREVFRALEMGAVDFLLKPSARASENLLGMREELVRKLLAIRGLTGNAWGGAARPLRAPPPAPDACVRAPGKEPPLVVIGASTGGPPALQFLLAALPPGWPGSIVVAQHMPALFTRIFAERLDRLVPLEVGEAREGEALRPGCCLILPGGQQGSLERAGSGLVVRLRERREAERYAPSVDLLFTSAAAAAGERVTAVVLTGMGDDGAEGVGRVRQAGGRTLAEAAETAVVFGMPQVAIRTGQVSEVLGLEGIARLLGSLVSSAPELAGVDGDRRGRPV